MADCATCEWHVTGSYWHAKTCTSSPSLTADLAAVDRATEADSATLRRKAERDLAGQSGLRKGALTTRETERFYAAGAAR